jgi:hypothetical protein
MKFRFPFLVIPALIFVGISASGSETVQVPTADTVLSTLDRSHPRLLMKSDGLERLKHQAKSDTLLQKYIGLIIRQADRCCSQPPLEHVLIGPRLLSVSRDCLDRIYALGMAWRLTGEEKYARKAEEDLLTVCAFPDWNPSHFLDTAEMSHAVGIGYDWFFSRLNPEAREKLRRGLIEHGMKPGAAAYSGVNGPLWWVKSEFNWNMVCNSGLLIGALAIAETDPEYARIIVPGAVQSMPTALASYAPDGAWGEGPGYWHYATSYVAYGLSALESALGTDFGLSKAQGLDMSGLFPLYTTGPTGLYLNFADSGENSRRSPMPCMFWSARTYKNTFISDNEHELMAQRGASAQHLVWYLPPSGKGAKKLDLDRRFKGKVDVAVFRSGWGADDLFVGVKGGYNQVNHGHLDLGNFELDALGVRWARDLGSDDYNLPDYWDNKKGGKRWVYYRLNSFSHSVPLLNNKSQDELGLAEFLKFQSKSSSSYVVIDLTSSYSPAAKSAKRGISLVGDRRAALVQDEFVLDSPTEITWAMTTDAEITLDGRRAMLKLKGKELTARILSPMGAQFTVESAEQQPPQKANRGVKRLLVRLPGQTGAVCVAVLLSPKWEKGEEVARTDIKPLVKW